MIDLKKLQCVIHNVQNVMAGYMNDDTWTDYDKKSHNELIEMQYTVEAELKKTAKLYSGKEVANMMKGAYKAGKDLEENKILSATLMLSIINKLINVENPTYNEDELLIIKELSNKYMDKLIEDDKMKCLGH